MVYTCEKCLFTFERVGEVSECPDCGKPGIRHATSEEAEEYKRIRAELSGDKEQMQRG